MAESENNSIGIVFRYRDLIANTLKEHQSTITSHGACWWGWWKRPTEDSRYGVWDRLRQELDKSPRGVWVGLFDSGADSDAAAVWRARVIAVEPPSPEGDPPPKVPPGDEKLVPKYYRSSPFSRAWIKLKEIDGPMAFFGKYSYEVVPPLPGIPEPYLRRLKGKRVVDRDELRLMDTTIWLVRTAEDGDPSDKFLAPGSTVIDPISAEPVAVKGFSILHLSDMHFSDESSEHTWAYPDTHGEDKSETLAGAVGRALERKKDDVAVLLVSGDLTSRAKATEFARARKSIISLMGNLDIGLKQLVIIPGNHDMAWMMDPDETYDRESDLKPNDEEMSAYRAFYYSLLRHEPHNDLTMGRRYVLANGIVLEVCGLNSSSLRTGSNYLPGLGRVPKHALASVAQVLNWDRPIDALALRFLVHHHHLTPTESVEDPAEYEKGFGMAIDAKNTLREATKFGVQLALHGHRHRPFIWREHVYASLEDARPEYALGQVAILGGGSVGSRDKRDLRNHFNLISISSDMLTVEVYRSEDGRPFSLAYTWCAPLEVRGGRLFVGPWRPPA